MKVYGVKYKPTGVFFLNGIVSGIVLDSKTPENHLEDHCPYIHPSESKAESWLKSIMRTDFTKRGKCSVNREDFEIVEFELKGWENGSNCE